MGIGLELSEVDQRVAAAITSALNEFERTVAGGLDHLTGQLDPEQRSSVVARTLQELATVQSQLLSGIDPNRADSQGGVLIGRLQELFSPGGPVAQRLHEALDPAAPSSVLGQGFASIRQEINALRDHLNQDLGRRWEAERGTAKGVDFEEQVEASLRSAARAMGAIVEHTGRTAGSLGAAAKVGDYLFTLPNGCRIAIEVKNQRSISLSGAQGVLAELDRAAANRQAEGALCISATDAYPQEIGPFGVFGHRVLVVDDGEGTMIWVGLRWLAASLSAQAGSEAIDLAAMADRLQRLRTLCQKFTSQKSALTDIAKSVGKVSEGLGEMREEVISLVDDLTRQVAAGTASQSRLTA